MYTFDWEKAATVLKNFVCDSTVIQAFMQSEKCTYPIAIIDLNNRVEIFLHVFRSDYLLCDARFNLVVLSGYGEIFHCNYSEDCSIVLCRDNADACRQVIFTPGQQIDILQRKSRAKFAGRKIKVVGEHYDKTITP